MKYKINKQLILEDAKIQDTNLRNRLVGDVDKQTNLQIAGAAGIPLVGNVGGFVGNNGNGHAVTSTLFGRSGNLGALSNNVEGVNLGDVYKKNLGLKTAAAGAIGTGLMMATGLDDTIGDASVDASANILDASGQHMSPESIEMAKNKVHTLNDQDQGMKIARGAAIGAVAPAVGYGLGKMFGSRNQAYRNK